MYYLMQRLPPLGRYTTCLIIGIIQGYYISPTDFICLGGIIIIAICLLNDYYPQYAKKSFYCIATCIFGYLLLHHQINSYRTIIQRYHHSSFNCTGTVTDYSFTPHLPLRHKIVISLETSLIKGADQPQKISGYSLAIHTRQSYKHLVGSRITINDINLKPSTSSFDFFCIRNRLLGSVHKQELCYQLQYCPSYSITRYLCHYKQRMILFFKNHMRSKTFTLFAALFLGNNDHIKKTIKPYQTTFQNWGIIHYLARSGLHLVIVTMLFEYMLYVIPWSFTIGRIGILFCGLLYYLLTWVSLSFHRALAVFVLAQCTRIIRKQHHSLHILFLVCFVFLMINPITLFFLDFQLTFSLTLALGLFNYARLKPLA